MRDIFTRRKANIIKAWRNETHREAALFILLNGGTASNSELAAHLRIPAKGLRQTMMACDLFVIEIRHFPGRDEHGHIREKMFYKIRDDAVMPPKASLGRLIRIVTPRRAAAPAIAHASGPVAGDASGQASDVATVNEG